MWGQKTEVLTPKVLAVRPDLHNGMHASLFPEDNKRKDVDQVQFCLEYCRRRYVLQVQACKRKEKKKIKLTLSLNKIPCCCLLGQYQGV